MAICETFQYTGHPHPVLSSATYDLNGNMTNKASPGTGASAMHWKSFGLNGGSRALTVGDGQTYTWDAANRLTKITYTGNASTEFSYDGYGRRVRIHEKNSGGSTITDKKYLWCDGNQPCEERNSAGSTVVKHFYPQGVYVPGASSPADKLFYTKDHLGSIRELTDEVYNPTNSNESAK